MMKILPSWLTVILLVGSMVVSLTQARSSEAHLSQAVGGQYATPTPAAMSPASASNVDATDRIAAGGRTATVFDPPSNVRDRPNGTIVCTLTTRRTINVYRYYDASKQWLSTDACGSDRYGVIHVSQLRF